MNVLFKLVNSKLWIIIIKSMWGWKIKFQKIKFILFLLILVFLLISVSILSLSKGSVLIDNKDIWLAIFQKGEALTQIIIWELRLPRLIASLLVGSSLGVSGALLQGMLKNSCLLYTSPSPRD